MRWIKKDTPKIQKGRETNCSIQFIYGETVPYCQIYIPVWKFISDTAIKYRKQRSLSCHIHEYLCHSERKTLLCPRPPAPLLPITIICNFPSWLLTFPFVTWFSTQWKIKKKKCRREKFFGILPYNAIFQSDVGVFFLCEGRNWKIWSDREIWICLGKLEKYRRGDKFLRETVEMPRECHLQDKLHRTPFVHNNIKSWNSCCNNNQNCLTVSITRRKIQ